MLRKREGKKEGGRALGELFNQMFSSGQTTHDLLYFKFFHKYITEIIKLNQLNFQYLLNA